MDRLLMGGVRPNDIKMGTTDVNEVYCDGILVWKRESEFENTYAQGPYLSASSTVKWTANDTSNEQVSYQYRSATPGSGSYEIDLRSIPSNATIIKATIQWRYGISKRNTAVPSSAYGGVESKIYFEGNDSNSTSIYGENSDKKLTCTTSIKPGVINTLNLSYKQKGNNFGAPNNGTNVSSVCTCSISDIELYIKYKV